ncbi:MAG: aldo/keto reductase [Acidilobus sp.]
MRYVSLGKGGPRVSAVGLGMWEIGSRSWGGSPDVARDLVSSAFENGINFFDTAEVYGDGRSEEALGSAVRALGLREHVIVASKVGGFRPSAYFIVKGAEAIRRRLGFTPSLLQLHWPPPAWIPLCSVIRGLEEALKKGLTEHIGVSNLSGHLLERALLCTASAEIVSDQVEYSLAYRTSELDVIPVAGGAGVSIIAYSPLAKGALAGQPSSPRAVQRLDKRFRAASEDGGLQSALEEVSRRLGVSRSATALAWLIHKGAVPIPGTTKPARVKEYASSADVVLPSELVRVLDEASSKYVTAWGRSYRNLQLMRLVPCGLQYLGIKLMGGA